MSVYTRFDCLPLFDWTILLVSMGTQMRVRVANVYDNIIIIYSSRYVDLIPIILMIGRNPNKNKTYKNAAIFRKNYKNRLQYSNVKTIYQYFRYLIFDWFFKRGSSLEIWNVWLISKFKLVLSPISYYYSFWAVFT